ncbi:MAG: hypothetical protein HC857_00605 [Synechococcales cyanobacterium RU_4_20]|nr:hypothetical protein [Synechococcales cyanobacterium RU_4_20]
MATLAAHPALSRQLVIESTRGVVVVVPAGGPTYRARQGSVLRQGDQVVATQGARIALDYNQGYLILSPKTRIWIEVLANSNGGAVTKLVVYRGQLWPGLRRLRNVRSWFSARGPRGILFSVRGG